MCHFLPVYHLGIAFLGRGEGQNISEGKNVFHFDVLKQNGQTIHLEKSLSDENKVLHSMGMCLTVQGV